MKETHWMFGRWYREESTEAGRQKWRFKAVGEDVRFDPQTKIPREQLGYHKRPSIFMPRWACRTILEVRDVRIERVQEITGADALLEGCTIDAIKEWLEPFARRAKTEPLHWIHGDDEGISYCLSCAAKRGKALLARPGNKDKDICAAGPWDGYSDSIEHCEDCGVILEASLTKYGVLEEMEHYDGDGIGPSNEGAYHFFDMLDSGDIPSRDDDFVHRVARIGFRWLWESINGPESWDRNDWVAVISYKVKEKT